MKKNVVVAFWRSSTISRCYCRRENLRWRDEAMENLRKTAPGTERGRELNNGPCRVLCSGLWMEVRRGVLLRRNYVVKFQLWRAKSSKFRQRPVSGNNDLILLLPFSPIPGSIDKSLIVTAVIYFFIFCRRIYRGSVHNRLRTRRRLSWFSFWKIWQLFIAHGIIVTFRVLIFPISQTAICLCCNCTQ